jgi:NADPH:quinone reductase-like Zn-dependent oxidoreductase
MKAIVCTKYGSPEVLQLQEVEKPAPKNNEVLIKVYASSVTAADGMIRKGEPFYGRLFLGLTKPKHAISGTGFSGVIESVGKDVKKFKKGDQVFGESLLDFGANAEYLCVLENSLLEKKPKNMTHEEAAPVCDGALTSYNFLKLIGKIERGKKVLINGASGSLGTAAVQLAKYYEAKVTGVCSTTNVELVKSLGADQVVDYTKEDFTKSGKTYDIIYDTIGTSSFLKCKASLTENGSYLSPVLGMPLLFQMLWTSIIGNKKAKFSATGILPLPKLQVLFNELIQLIELGKVKSHIDKRYQLEQIVEAHHYVETGRKKGNVVTIMET